MDEEIERYNCQYCMGTFKDRRCLNIHLLTHTNIKQHSCSKCNRKFTQKAGLYTHFRAVHLRIKPYSCSLCSSQKFSSKYELHLHIGTHGKDERHYRCQMCAATFVQKIGFLKHLNSARHAGR